MIWVIGNKGMLGSEVCRQLAEKKYNFTGTDREVDITDIDALEGFVDSSDGVNYTVNDNRKYMNDKGLITRDRQIRKDVFYLYKAWWNDSQETVYISGRRLKSRPAGQTFTLTVYSNAKSLKVFCNNKIVAEKQSSDDPTGVIWKFDGLQMGSGTTTFKVESDRGTIDKVTFLPI